jgi:TPR repeat protein
MYDRAAGSGSGLAAVAMGMTFDPLFLATIGVHAVAPDPKRAIIWYQRASDLGSAEGTRLLAQLRTTIIP